MAIQAVLLLFSSLCAQFLTGYAATLPKYPSLALPINSLLNNKAATSAGGRGSAANFDGDGGAYDSQFLPTGSWEYDGLTVSFTSSLPTPSQSPSVRSPILMGQERRQRVSGWSSSSAAETHLRPRAPFSLCGRWNWP
jgi:hypothetical protein